MPKFNLLAGKAYDLHAIYSPVVILSIIAVIFIVGIIGGSYPAFYLSRFSPVTVLKGSFTKGTGGSMLHVPNLQDACDFYIKIGFTEHFIFPRQGWGDLGAGGFVDHRIAVNVWAGLNAPKPPTGIAGLYYFTLKYDTEARLMKALNNLKNAEVQGEGYTVTDTGGNKIMLSK